MAGTLNSIGRGGAGRGGMITGINVTPLVDVVLVLLIILMVSSTYVVAQTLKVQLPKASATDGPADAPIKITMTAGGSFLLDNTPTSRDAIRSTLREAIQKNPAQNVVISADTTVAHGNVVSMIDLAKQAGVTHFAINVEMGK